MMLRPGGFVPPANYYLGLFLLVFAVSSALVNARKLHILEVSIPPLLQTSPPKGEVLYVVTHDPSRKPQTLELSCKADGLPPPQYTWMKNGRKIDIDGVHVFRKENSGTIYFPNPKASDEGEYQCIASNSAGTVYSDVTSVKRVIAVAFPKGEPRVVTVDLGDPLELPCENPGGYPEPSLHWVLQKSNGNLRSVTSPRTTVDEEGTLWFSAVTLDDASEDALYACAASSITRASFVTVNDLAGRTEYRMGNWVYLNVSLPPDFEENGITSPEIIHSAPFLQHVTDGNRTVLKGQDFRLYCIYGGYPDINTRWWHADGLDLTDKIIEFGKALEFVKSTERDEGAYFCQASNSGGESEEKSFNVRIEEPPKFIEKPSTINQPAGESAIFLCRVTGKPSPHITWSVNGVLIPNEHQSVLKFDKLRPEDKGVIGCNASNPHGYVYATGFLNVLSMSPEIINPPKDQKEFRGAPVTLTCEAYGAPDPEITWERKFNLKGAQNSVPIHSDENYEVRSNSLHIKALTEELTGQYSCLARNKFAWESAQAGVSLIKYTRVKLTLSSLYINVSDSVSFTCVIEGDSNLIPKVMWIKNEDNLNLSNPKYTLSETNMTLVYAMDDSDNDTVQTISTLTIENAEGVDSGVYSCIVKTAVDETEDSQILTVQDVPDRPILVNVECGASEAFIHWKFGGSEHSNRLNGFIIEEQTDLSQVRWHKVEEIVPATDQALKVSLRPGRMYSFRVLAVNEMGHSQPSEPSEKCITLPRVPNSNPLDVRAVTVDANTIKVVWKVVEPINHNGPDFRYEVDWAAMKGVNENYAWQKIIIEDWEQSETLLEGLLPHSLYKVKVLSANEVGMAKGVNSISAYSGAEIPEGSPTNLRVRRITKSSAILAWVPVSSELILGLLKGYQVEIQNLDNFTITMNASKQKLIVDGRASRAVLTHLHPFTLYTARVRVLNNRYAGPYSREVTFRTGQSASSEVLNLTAKPLSSDSLLVKFDPPLKPSGVISGYSVSYKPIYDNEPSNLEDLSFKIILENDTNVKRVVVNSDELQVKLPFLLKETRYLIKVYAKNAAGLGKEAAITTMTEMFPLAPPVAPIFHLQVDDLKKRSITTARATRDRDVDGDFDEIDYKLRVTILTDLNGDGEISRDDVLDVDHDGDIDEVDVNATDINNDGIVDRKDLFAADNDNDGDVDFYDIGDKNGDGVFDDIDVLLADTDGDGDIDAQDNNGRNVILQDIDRDGDIDEDDITDIDGDGYITDEDIKALDVDKDGDVDMNDLILADKDDDGDVDGADISDFNGNGRIDEDDFKIKDIDRDGDVDERDYYLRNVFITDIDGDGDIDNDDLIDQNGDGHVDIKDLNISDLNMDGNLDARDLMIGDSDGDGDVDKNDVKFIDGGEESLMNIHKALNNTNIKLDFNTPETLLLLIDVNKDSTVNQADVAVFDKNGDGKIDSTEFLSENWKLLKLDKNEDDRYNVSDAKSITNKILDMFLHLVLGLTKDVIHKVFSILDVDNNNFVDGFDLTLLDGNKDGDVDVTELKQRLESQIVDNRNRMRMTKFEKVHLTNNPIFLWDADEDGKITMNDVIDVNRDGDIDGEDFKLVDINKDGKIDDADLTAGDVDKDGDIDFSDVGDEDKDGDIDSDDLKIADEDGDGDIDTADDNGEYILLMDFNKDGKINDEDVTDVNKDGVTNEEDRDALDVNNDGRINIYDIRKGDRDGDQDIDAADINDVDGDGDVDWNDLAATLKEDDIDRNDLFDFTTVLADTDADGDIDKNDVLDINRDGKVTEEDIYVVDLNEDGVITKEDVALADRDGDGDVDIFDIGDINKDGNVDIYDALAAYRRRHGVYKADDGGDRVKIKFDWQPSVDKHSGSAFYIEYRPMGVKIWRQSPVIEKSLRHEITGFNPEMAYEVRMVAKDGRFETTSETRRVGPFRNVEQVKDPTLGAVMENGSVDPLLWTWFIVSVMAAITMLCAVFFSIWVYNHRMSKVAEMRKQLYEGVETSIEEGLSKDDVEAPLNGIQDVEEPLTAAKQRPKRVSWYHVQMAALLRRQETTQSVDSFASQDDDFSEYGDEAMVGHMETLV